MRTALTVALTLFLAILPACASSRTNPPVSPSTGLTGTLLLIGGGLQDDNTAVYKRFLSLASPKGVTPRIVIATAASGDQDAASSNKVESIRIYSPSAVLDTIRRETPAGETIALIDQATAMFFTGGDQKRITDRYRPDGVDTPEAAAMRRLLARGGVIAGTSAGDAMMSDPMFLTGRSAEALGIRSTRRNRAADDDPDDSRPARELPFGPQIGPGMALFPWAIADSHFFERHRFGRLVAALEQSGKPFGIGVSEDACVEVDLATGVIVGISEAESLLVDARAVVRDTNNIDRRGVRARVIHMGDRISLIELQRSRAPTASPVPSNATPLPTASDRSGPPQAARFFNTASRADTAVKLSLDGYSQIAWPDPARPGWSEVAIRADVPPAR